MELSIEGVQVLLGVVEIRQGRETSNLRDLVRKGAKRTMLFFVIVAVSGKVWLVNFF